MYEFSKKGRHRDLLNLLYERIPMGFLPLNLLIVNYLERKLRINPASCFSIPIIPL